MEACLHLLEIDKDDQILIESFGLWDDKEQLVEYGVNYTEDK